MNQVFQFAIHHWVLVGLFVLLLIALIIEESKSQGFGKSGLAPQKVVRMMNHEDVTLLDIRNINDFKDGHIVNAINIPQEALNENMKKIEKYKQQPLIIICGNGQKSPMVASKLRKLGFEKIYVLTGGISAWKNAGIPLIKG